MYVGVLHLECDLHVYSSEFAKIKFYAVRLRGATYTPVNLHIKFYAVCLRGATYASVRQYVLQV